MTAKAVLLCRPNSLPFADRTLLLEQPVKIGRSHLWTQISKTNGLFNCKVMSQNHALIWYDGGKFYLKDTNSSNGTYVNNQRLSESQIQSSTIEINSGDIVQFGLNITDQVNKVTNFCVVAKLKLYPPGGKESKMSLSMLVPNNLGTISVEELYQLNQYIQNSLQKEQLIETKLASLQQVTMSLNQASDLLWNTLISEDKLLSTTDILENKLQTYAKNFTEDALKNEICKLQEEKSIFLHLSKECLQKVLNEKLEAFQKCQDIEKSLMNAEEKCAKYELIMEHNQAELQDLNKAQAQSADEILTKSKEVEVLKETLSRTQLENKELNSEIYRLLLKKVIMQKEIKELKASKKYMHRQLSCIQSQLVLKRPPDNHDHLVSFKEENNTKENSKENKQNIKKSIDSLISKLASLIDVHSKLKEKLDLTQAQIYPLRIEKFPKFQQINSLEAKLELKEDKSDDEENVNQQLLLSSLKENYKQGNMTSKDTALNNPSFMNISEELSDNSNTTFTEILEKEITNCEEEIEESHDKAHTLRQTITILKADLCSYETSLNDSIKNWQLLEEKLVKDLMIKKFIVSTLTETCSHPKSLETSINQTELWEEKQFELEEIDKYKEEAVLLKQQAANQNNNEAELLNEKLGVASTELGISKSNTETNMTESQLDDNPTQVLSEASFGTVTSLASYETLNSQDKNMKNESSEKKQELEESNQIGTESPVDKDPIIKELRSRVSEMEDKLFVSKLKYMACHENNIQLERKCSSLKLGCQAFGGLCLIMLCSYYFLY